MQKLPRTLRTNIDSSSCPTLGSYSPHAPSEGWVVLPVAGVQWLRMGTDIGMLPFAYKLQASTGDTLGTGN